MAPPIEVSDRPGRPACGTRAALERSWCAATQRRSYPVDKIFPLLASLTAVPEVEAMRGHVVISHEAATINVGDGRLQKLNRVRY